MIIFIIPQKVLFSQKIYNLQLHQNLKELLLKICQNTPNSIFQQKRLKMDRKIKYKILAIT